MGSEELTVPISPLFYKKFEELFPLYLSYGMTYQQYWEEDCTLTNYYRQANEINLKRINMQLWLQGAYIYEAICDVSPILNPFAKKGTKVVPYSKEPYILTEKEKKEREAEEQKKKMEEIRAKFLAFANQSNKKVRAKNGGTK